MAARTLEAKDRIMSARQVSENLGSVVVFRDRKSNKITATIYNTTDEVSVFKRDAEDSNQDYLTHFQLNWEAVSPAMRTTLNMLDEIDDQHDLSDFLGMLAGDVANAIEALLMDRVKMAMLRMEMPPSQKA